MRSHQLLYTATLFITLNVVVLAFSPTPRNACNNFSPDSIQTSPNHIITISSLKLSGSPSLHRHRSPALSAVIIDPSTAIESTTAILSAGLDNVLSNENIKQAFSLATFGPQYLWILLVLFPNTNITKKVMGGYGGILVFSLIHFFIVVASATQENGTAPIEEFNGVFDPTGDPQAAMIGMMRYPNFVTEEWSHVLTWDLFVGRWIWLDGLKRGIFTPHSVLLTNLIGPPGFLLHYATCLVTGKGIVGNEALEAEVLEEDDQ